MNTIRASLASLACSATVACAGPVESLAIELGITPDLLAVSGFNAAEAAAILANLGDAQSHRDAFESIREETATIAESLRDVVDQIRSDPGNASLREQHTVLEWQLSNAQSAESHAEAVMLDIALAGQSQAKKEELARCRNHTEWAVTTHMLAITHHDDGWRTLEAALKAEARSQRRGEPLRPSYQEALLAARSHPMAVQAQIRIDRHLEILVAMFANM